MKLIKNIISTLQKAMSNLQVRNKKFIYCLSPIANCQLFVACCLLLASCGGTTAENTSTKDSTAKRQDHVQTEIELTDAQIAAIGLQTGSIEERNLKSTLKVNGKLMLPPQNQAQVSMLSGGIVKSITVSEGNFVQQGQTLATIQNNEVVQLQQDYLENKSRLKYLEAEYNRQKELQEDNINAAKTFQQVENEFETAKAKQKGTVTKLQLLGIDANSVSENNFKNFIAITAPINGFIHHINITIGKFADANSILFEIVDNRYLHLDLTVFEKDIHKVSVGQKITFTDANDISHVHPAMIYSLDKAFQDNQQAIIAHAKIEEKTETLLPGMYVEARIQIDNYKANALPNEAIVSNGDEHYIYAQTKPNHFKQIQVTTGATDMGYTEIIPLEEIPADAKIVTKGAYYLLSQLTKGEGEHDE